METKIINEKDHFSPRHYCDGHFLFFRPPDGLPVRHNKKRILPAQREMERNKELLTPAARYDAGEYRKVIIESCKQLIVVHNTPLFFLPPCDEYIAVKKFNGKLLLLDAYRQWHDEIDVATDTIVLVHKTLIRLWNGPQ